ncbi:protein tiptop-like isoform X2 [Ornithodoros turicata]|uniref:protein tiptop-like isoform X2 n=1 Tax=Ornithodoros turicata TaxID=34597 RepID=UPI003138F15B
MTTRRMTGGTLRRTLGEEGDTKGDPAASGEDAKEEGSVTSDARSGSPQPESPPTLSPAPPEEEECPQTSPLAAAPSTPDAPPDGTLREGDDVAPVDTRAPAESKDVELANRDEDDVPLKIAEPAKESEDDMLRHVSVKTEEPVDELLADGEGPQEGTADAPLDFSIKKSASPSGMDSEDDDVPPSSPTCQNGGVDCPLDLSLSKRKARHSTPEHRPAKVGRLEQGTLPGTSSPWSGFSGGRTPSAMPQASRVRPPAGNQPPWNGKIKRERSTSEGHHSSATISAVGLKTPHIAVPEKMPAKADAFRAANRQNPWQSQWISRSGEQTKDVFTCVWCKESFQSLADMTLHMKQSPRCGMAGMHAASAVPPPPVGGSSGCNRTATTPPPKLAATPPGGGSSGSTGATTKDGVPLPRKLVRGQDVWLGKGAEQTRQILKCMWCGQSFKSLADMTTHMRVTQHYTNIISQEQIISWRTPEDKVANQSQVNAVLTCKVCDQAFGSLKELSYHMVKNSHYKEHILRSITEGGGRRRQTRERRKKSLPVRKLLELERMEMTTRVGSGPQASPSPAAEIDGKIACEECAEKVDAKDFVQHIKSCSRSQQLLKTALQARLEPNGPVESRGDEDGTPEPRPRSAQSTGEPDRAPSVDSNAETSQLVSGSGGTSSTSVLNAIEKLIEKSFDNKGKRGGPSSAGILQRLGIDEEVYPPWHPAGSPRYSGGPTKSPLPRLTPSGLTSPCPSLPDDHHQAPILQPASQCSTPSRYHAVSPDRHSGVSSPRHRDASDKDSEPPLLDPERISQPRSPSESSSTRASTPGGDDLIIADGDVRTSSRRSSERGLDTDDVTSSSSCEAPVLVPTERRRSSPSPRPIVPPVHKRSSVSPRPQSLNRTQLKKERNNNRQSDDATSDHPLKELQKLLDKTDAHLSRSSVPQASAGGSILAFSWACNDAANASDSLMKCAFCDTHFVSKGAYRHHLSKMHFIKDGGPLGGEGSPPWKGSQNKDSTANGSEGANQPQSSTNNSGASGGIDSINSPSASPAAVDESPHSKFLKYTELAKQLSSKYV